MIFDNLENLEKYEIVTPEVLEFVNKLNVNTPCGRYDITDKIFANIEEYFPRGELECALEAHRKFIDIQLLISGEERIDFIDIDGLNVLKSYDCVKDILFFKRPKVELGRIYLNGRNFAIFYPDDAHAPQITTLSLQNNVKKVVVKIPVDWLL